MIVKPAQIRTWSMLGSRGTFGVALTEHAAENNKIAALTADLGTSSGLDRFRDSYADRFINVGIAEQSMVGIAAGLAADGWIPFTTTFASFCLRCCEQIRHYLGYMNENVKVAGLAAGFATGVFGTSHHGIEDVAAMRSISNLTIVSPADGLETVKAVAAAAALDGPVYLRLTGGMNLPIVYREDYDFTIGKAVCVKPDGDIAIIAAGTMVYTAVETVKLLAESGINAAVYDMHTIKPIDTELLDRLCDKKLIVSIEEHSVIGGLGSAIAEYYSDKACRTPHMIIGIPQGYAAAGDYAYLLESAALTPRAVSDRIIASMR